MIEEMWKTFAKAIFGRTPIEKVQHDEMRKAFYGGATAMLHCVQATGEDEFTEEQGVQLLNDLQEECEGFMKEMLASIGAKR